jgi:hypothetical protein
VARQEMLRHRDVKVSSVIEDCVLRRPVGNDKVLSEQLRQLADWAARPNVSIRILPLSAGVHAGHYGAFRIIDLPPPDPSFVHLEYPTGATYMEDAQEVELYSRIFKRLEDIAMTSEQSIELITKLSGDKTV